MNKQNQKKKEEKHKLSPSCFNKCVQWSLNTSISYNKTSIGYIFQAKSLFLKKLEVSILNSLQNNYTTIQEPTKNSLANFEETSNLQLSTKEQEKENSITNIKFPLDNTKFNFMIIDANLGMMENLCNLFFLEFDLTSSLNKRDQLRFLREINNDCVEREIFFVLNGTIHGTPIFKREIKFSVETRKFIKSMQFRLETYKNEIKTRKRSNKNADVKTIQNTFYTKILSNTNIGIEFYKPTYEANPEKFPSNFNSVVNANILLNKIYLEVCIPKIFTNNEITFDSSNKSEEGSIKTSQEPEKVHKNTKNNTNIIKSKPQSPLNSFNNGARFQPNPRTLHFKSPEYIKRSPVPGNYHSNNTTNFPSPFSAGIFYPPQGPYQNLPSTNSSSSSDFHNNGGMSNTMGHMPLTTRRLSENIYERRNENPLSNMMNSIRSSPMYMKINPDFVYSGKPPNFHFPAMTNNGNQLINFKDRNGLKDLSSPRDNSHNFFSNGFISPRGFYHQNKEVLENVKIKRCADKEKITDKLKILEKNNEHLRIYTEHFKGSCNFSIFMRSCTPHIAKKNMHQIGELTLSDFLSCFGSSSVYGLDVSYFIKNEIAHSTYSPTLSSLVLILKDKEICQEILKEIGTCSKHSSKASALLDCLETEDSSERLGSSNECFLGDFTNLKLIVNYKTITIEFSEVKPPHSRNILIRQIESLFNSLDSLKHVPLAKIEKRVSYFSVLYSPFKSTHKETSNCAFLVYYQFDVNASTSHKKSTQGIKHFSEGNTKNYINEIFSEVPIIGILPIKFNNKIFMQEISNPDAENKNDYIIEKCIENVYNTVLKNSGRTSVDFDFYLKNSSI